MYKVYDEHKQAYVDAGYWPRRVYPSTPTGKGCKDNWQSNEAEVPAKDDSYEGIALRTLSPIPGGYALGFIDVDDDRLVRLFRALLKPKCARVGQKGMAIPVRLDRVEQNTKLKFGNASKAAVELLFGPYICVIPPTYHSKAKKNYEWVGHPLLETAHEDLPLIDHEMVEFITALIQNKQIEALIDGEGAHDAALKMVRIINARTDDDKMTFKLIEAMLPEGYKGNTLKELPEMIKSERAKVASGKLPKIETELQFKKNGSLMVNARNTEIILDRMRITTRYDEFADGELVTIGEAKECPARDDLEQEIRHNMDLEYGYQISGAAFRDVMAAVSRRNRFHPLKSYLKSLEWDGVERIGSWLVTYGGAEDTEYVREVSKLVLLGAVRRAMHPGAKFDQMLVMHGVQGCGKSTAVKILAKNEDWFCDSLHMEAKDKELIEQTQGKWLIEMSELRGMNRSQAEHVKAMVSRTHDRARKAYGRITEEKARCFIMIGTTNEIEFLRDDTGNRRFWPVGVGSFKLDELKRDRDQLWAEAYAIERTSIPIVMKQELWAVASVTQEKHRVRDNPYVDILKEVLDDVKDGRIKSVEVQKMVNVDFGKFTNAQYKTLKSAMLELGWKYKPLIRFKDRTTGGYQIGDGVKEIFAGHESTEY
jgi:predicted P-loop ATPase